jgi:hypothetical protein
MNRSKLAKVKIRKMSNSDHWWWFLLGSSLYATKQAIDEVSEGPLRGFSA